MSDFRFACPHCSQRISGDSSYKGRQIECPACHQTFTVPAPAPRAPIAQHAEPAAAPAVAEPVPGKTSPLAFISLVCSLGIGVGSIPGIVLGHLARSRIKHNPALGGKGMATAALIINYCFLVAAGTVVALGFFVLQPLHGHQIPVKEQAAYTSALSARRVDEVKIGDPASESQHQMKGSLTRGGPNMKFMDRNVRDAVNGGCISYVMKVDPGQPMNLYCTYWGSDTGGRRFDILIDDAVIAKQTLDYNVPGNFFDVEYRIPQKLTQGKTNVTVVFQAYPSKTVGGLYALQMLKR